MDAERIWQIESEARMPEAMQVELERGRVCYYSTAGPTRAPDESNEDSVAILEAAHGEIVLAVADGVGGHPAGEHASRLALEQLAQALRENAVAPLRIAILDGFERANREVIAMGKGAATTLSVVDIGEDGLRSYHAGDSTSLVVGQRGRLKFLSMSHSPVGYALEAGFLDESEAMVHEERHLISNLVGSEEMSIQVGPRVSLSPRDTVVVGSDGVFDNVTTDEVIALVRKGPLAPAAEALRKRCQGRMERSDTTQPSKPDDMSFVLFRSHHRPRNQTRST